MRNTPLPHKRLLFPALALLPLLWSCNSDRTATGGPIETPNGLCATPQFLVSLRFLPEDTTHTDIIRGIVVVGSDLFFSTFHTIYRVSTAGGEPVKMGTDRSGGLYVVNDRVFMIYTGYDASSNSYGKIVELSRTGTEVTPLAITLAPDGGQKTLESVLWMDATHVYYETSLYHPSGGVAFGYNTYALHRVPWAGGTPEKLADLGSSRVSGFFKEGEKLFFRMGYHQAKASDPDTLASLPAAGGAVTKLRTMQSMDNLLNRDATSIYLETTDTATYARAVAKLPMAGGEPVPFYHKSMDNLWLDGSGMIFAKYGQVKTDPDPLENWALGIYTLASPGDTPKYIGCVPEGLGEYTIHDRVLSGKALYLSAAEPNSRKYGIIRYPLP